MSWFTVAPPSEVVADRRQASAYRSVKYCLPVWSNAMSVSPPPGGSMIPEMALGGGPGEITRNVRPPSTEANQVLRWVPVPVGPLTNTRPCGSIPMSGSPLVWIGSTTVGVPNVMDVAVAPALLDVPAGGRPDRRRHRPDGRAELRPPPARGHARRVRRGGTGPVAAGERVGVPGRGRDLRPHHARAAGPGSAGPGLADGRLAADPQPRHRRGQPGDGLAGR